MTSLAIGASALCAVCVAVISLTSSHIYRKEPSTSTVLMAVVSFLPGFLFALIATTRIPWSFGAGLLLIIFLKNVLYCASFTIRYESLRKFGPFTGTLMLGAQPPVVFLLAATLLGESLTIEQVLSVFLVAIAVWLLGVGRNNEGKKKIAYREIFVWLVFPTLAAALTVVVDRYFLKDRIDKNAYFSYDRLMILPAFFTMLFCVRGKNLVRPRWRQESSRIIADHWKSLLVIGVFFTLSVYTYNFALSLEKAALVGLFRNSGYPVAALIGAALFRKEVSVKEWTSFALIVLAVPLGAA